MSDIDFLFKQADMLYYQGEYECVCLSGVPVSHTVPGSSYVCMHIPLATFGLPGCGHKDHTFSESANILVIVLRYEMSCDMSVFTSVIILTRQKCHPCGHAGWYLNPD